MDLITYEDKEQININADIPDKNKVNASDLNQIKTVINAWVLPYEVVEEWEETA